MTNSAVLAFQRIARQLVAPKEVLSPTKWRLRMPGGFNYDAFNGNAALQLWSLQRMIESGRVLAFHKQEPGETPFAELNEVYKTNLQFIVASKVTISPAAYDPDIKKGPLILEKELDYLKGKSMRLRNTLSLESTQETLCTMSIQSVFVDPQTRKASEPPEWWVKKFSAGLKNDEVLRPARLSPPEKSELMRYKLCVPPSDCDQYLHINWAFYPKYCMDAWILNAYNKAGGNAKDFSFIRNPRNVTISYLKEATMNDKLNVVFWKDPKSNDLFHFQVLKDANILSEISIDFFPPL